MKKGSFIIWIGVLLTVLALRWMGILQGTELIAHDQFLRLTSHGQTDSRILIVTITEEYIRSLKHWPVDDHTLAMALKIILQGSPLVVGLDLYRDLQVPPGYEELEPLLANEPRIYGIAKLPNGSSGVPAPPALPAHRVGFNDLPIDSDDVIRRGLLYLTNDEKTHWSFGLKMALAYLVKKGVSMKPSPTNAGQIILGDALLPPVEPDTGGYMRADTNGYSVLLDFWSGSRRFDTVTFGDVVRGAVDPSRFTDRIVLIGPHAASIPDLFTVPVGDYGKTNSPYSVFSSFSETPSADQDAKMPGVAIHAHVISQLVRMGLGESTPPRAIPEIGMVISMVLGALAGVIVGTFGGGVLLSITWLLLGSAILLGMALTAALYGLWMPVMAPLLAWVLGLSWMGAYVLHRVRSERGQMMQLFSNYLSPVLAENLWESRDEFLSQGRPRNQRLTITALFLDMKGYTQQAGLMEPDALMSWVNTFMETMSECIARHDGLVDDFFGDGIKADFGVPVPRHSEQEIRQDAFNGVSCAIDLGHQLERLNHEWRSQGLPTAGMRIGVHTGKAIAGCLGSNKRLKYTTVGAEVILAQRLESYSDTDHDFSREPYRIIISETTYRYVAGQVEAHCLGPLQLKGKNEPVTGYRLMGLKTAAIDAR
ncbi:adenylate cyclase [Gammaproteobacteria bacterium]